MEINIRKRTYHEFGDPKKPLHVDDEVYFDDSPFEMGEGTASVYRARCKRHMKDTWHISGYNQGGHDSVDICLDCAADIEHYFRYNPKTEVIVEKSEEEKKPSKYEDELFGADPNCDHDVRPAPGGGVKCTKCPGWFCF
jgi:hypothetical protein